MNTTTMTITIPMNEGNIAYFKIQFKKEDFMKVVDSIEIVTLENVQNNPLFTIV